MLTSRLVTIFFKLTAGRTCVSGPQDPPEYLAQLKNRGLTRTTVARKMLPCVRSINTWPGEIVDKACFGSCHPETTVAQFLYPQEMLELLELLPSTPGHRDRAIINPIWCGYSLQELVGLDLEDLDLAVVISSFGKGTKSGWYL